MNSLIFWLVYSNFKKKQDIFIMHFPVSSLALLSIVPQSLAAPAPAPAAVAEPPVEGVQTIEQRQLLNNLLPGLLPGVVSRVGHLLDDVNSAVAEGNPSKVVDIFEQLQPTERPTKIQDAVAEHANIWATPTTRTDFFAAVATQIAGGLVLDETLKAALNGALPVGENSVENNNSPPPSPIYPKKKDSDVPYTLSEPALRKAIFIPLTFTYGAKRPVIFVPGTAAYGGVTFASNLRNLLAGKAVADPVWLNVPGASLNDTQSNAEYIAYAINLKSVCDNYVAPGPDLDDVLATFGLIPVAAAVLLLGLNKAFLEPPLRTYAM